MQKHHFKFTEVFMFGWNKTCQHAWFVFLTFIISSILLTSTAITAYIVSPFIYTAVVIMVVLSLSSISLMIVRNHAFTFSDLYYPLLSPRRVLKFSAIGLLYIFFMLFVVLSLTILLSPTVTSFGTTLGIILLVPSVLMTIRLQFFPFVVIEHEHSSLSELVFMSFKLTENNFWPLLGFVVLSTIINLLGVWFFGVGLLVTIPVTSFACAHLYDKFKNHTA